MQEFDRVIREIADYVTDVSSFDATTYQAAKWACLDALGCAFAGLQHPTCAAWIAPMVEGETNRARIPGTNRVVSVTESVRGFGAAVRWLDFNDTWLAAEWGHPSDNLAALLPIADFLCRGGIINGVAARSQKFTMRDVLDALARAYEIQGVLAIDNSLNRHGFDHVLFVKVATTAALCRLFGATHSQVLAAVSNAFADAGPLRVYRHGVNTGWRKSWAAADASTRALQFAWMAMRGESGYPSALTADVWGFEDVIVDGKPLTLAQPLADYIIRNVLFKVRYPAEFHGQTALEAAIKLHPQVASQLEDIDRIQIWTHEAAIRIIDKKGVLRNPADRDHCLQYIVATGLLKGNLIATDYDDEAAADPRIDMLRERMDVIEYLPYSEDYLASDKRSAASRLCVTLKNGTMLPPVEVLYPLGHPRRRVEAKDDLVQKFTTGATAVFGTHRAEQLATQLWDDDAWMDTHVDAFVDLLIP